MAYALCSAFTDGHRHVEPSLCCRNIAAFIIIFGFSGLALHLVVTVSFAFQLIKIGVS